MQWYDYDSVSIFALGYNVITLSFSENETSFGECFDYNFSRYNWKFRHPEGLPRQHPGGIGFPSSFKTSKYNSIASLIFLKVSSLFTPSEMQPGSAGTLTVNPPSSCDSSITVNFTEYEFKILI